jgi:nitronate monooxygenase
MVLIPAVVDAVGEIPVLAAGGITSGRSIVAALALGASGVWMGTRFLGAREASIHSDYRERLFRSKETDTFYSELFNKGWECSHRTLKNSTFDRWDKAGRPEPGARPGETDVVAVRSDGSSIERYTSATPHETFTGEIEALPMWAGQGVHAVKCLQSASEIFLELVGEAQECLGRL